ncbi:MAG: nitroreductase family protein [Nitrososphaeria archaeon]
MDCIDSILGRRSVRKFLQEPVKRELILKVLFSGASAPSAHNEQPWHFIVIDRDDIKEAIAQKMMKAYISSGKADKTKAMRSYDMIVETPIIIIGCLDRHRLKYSNELEYKMGIQSLAAAAENMLVAASCLGLGSYWRAAPLVTAEILRHILGVPDYIDPQWMIHLGYAAGEPKPKVLRNDINHWNYW